MSSQVSVSPVTGQVSAPGYSSSVTWRQGSSPSVQRGAMPFEVAQAQTKSKPPVQFQGSLFTGPRSGASQVMPHRTDPRSPQPKYQSPHHGEWRRGVVRQRGTAMPPYRAPESGAGGMSLSFKALGKLLGLGSAGSAALMMIFDPTPANSGEDELREKELKELQKALALQAQQRMLELEKGVHIPLPMIEAPIKYTLPPRPEFYPHIFREWLPLPRIKPEQEFYQKNEDHWRGRSPRPRYKPGRIILPENNPEYFERYVPEVEPQFQEAQITLTSSAHRSGIEIQRRTERARVNKKQKDVKSTVAPMYRAMLGLINATYGTVDEIQEIWKALYSNTTYDFHARSATGIYKFDDWFQSVVAGEAHVDWQGVAEDIFWNQVEDAIYGMFGRASRKYQEAAGITPGLFSAHKNAARNAGQEYDLPRIVAEYILKHAKEFANVQPKTEFQFQR